MYVLLQAGRTMGVVCKCYFLLLLVTSLILNYIWASPNPAVGGDWRRSPAMTNMERLFTFLYLISIIILLGFMAPGCLPSYLQTRLSIQIFYYFDIIQ